MLQLGPLILAVLGGGCLVLLLSARVRTALSFHLTADTYSQQRDAAIDGIRGVVACSVMVAHYSQMPTQAPIKAFADAGFTLFAVSMFAAMSGYVLYAGLYRIETSRGITAVDVKSFLWRRFFRIYPLYVVYFVITLAAILILSDHVGARLMVTLLSDLLMLNLLSFGWYIDSPIWSLYPEMVFSVLLPLWMLFVGRGWKSAVAAYVLLSVFSWAGTPAGPTDPSFNLMRYFFLGIVIFRAVAALRERPALLARLMPALYGVFVLGCVVAPAFNPWLDMGHGTVPGWVESAYGLYRKIGVSFHQDLCIILLPAPIILCPWIRKAFSNPPMVFLGVISYGIYILHLPLLGLFSGLAFSPVRDAGIGRSYGRGIIDIDFLAPAAGFGEWSHAVYLLAVLGTATICHFIIERPMIRYGYALARRLDAARG
ncbi:MAG: acyltransferase [Phaeospirillum sp.]|nr:acyltransferase [Phaeospirillum sp.]